MRSLDASIRDVARRDPARPILRDLRAPERAIVHTYGDFDRQVDRLAAQIAPLDAPIVGVMLSTSADCLSLVYAVMRAGKDVLLLDPEWGVRAQEAVAAATSLRAVVADGEVTGPLARLQVALSFEAAGAEAAVARLDPAAAERTRILVFTSGTTSQPKGIVLTQAAMLAAYDIGQRCLGIGEGTQAGCFYRVSGLGILGIHFLFPILYGGSVALLPAHAYLDPEFWNTVRSNGINFLYVVPPIANLLVKECTPPAVPFTLDELLCVAGSARLDPEIQRQFQDRFAPLANIYGLSECGFAFLFGHRRGDRFDNSVGPAVGLELRILDEQGREVETPGVQGRLQVRTPGMFEGYLNQPELTQRVVQDGWLETNDIAWFDEQRCTHMIGRADGTIKKAGNLFHLVECEEALTGLAHVVEAACVKVACELHGEDYVAVVRTSASAEPFDYQAWLEEALGTTRAPRGVVVSHQELPRNGAGKYDRNALLQFAEA